MSSGTFIIESAYKRIGVHSVAKAAAPEDIEDGKDTLNAMLQAWQSKDIFLETVPLDKSGDELGEPMDARNAIIDNLAIMCAPNFDNGKVVVSQQLKDNARAGMALVNSLYRVTEIPKKKVSKLTVRGSGHGRHHGTRIFMGDNNELSD